MKTFGPFPKPEYKTEGTPEYDIRHELDSGGVSGYGGVWNAGWGLRDEWNGTGMPMRHLFDYDANPRHSIVFPMEP